MQLKLYMVKCASLKSDLHLKIFLTGKSCFFSYLGKEALHLWSSSKASLSGLQWWQWLLWCSEAAVRWGREGTPSNQSLVALRLWSGSGFGHQLMLTKCYRPFIQSCPSKALVPPIQLFSFIPYGPFQLCNPRFFFYPLWRSAIWWHSSLAESNFAV